MKKTICLNMIVKDEADVIERALESVKPLIDTWVIVDTGSTDGTQEIIRKRLQGIPGELHERPWKNFGHNRNEALDLARGKADYFLFIDADDRLLFDPAVPLPELEDDYYIVIEAFRENRALPPNYNQRVFLIRDLPDFRWTGVLHERMECDPTRTFALLSQITYEYRHDGNRSKDQERCTKDIQILKEALQENPHDSRALFYLAQTYRSAGQFASALECYEKTAAMGGDEAQVFYSLYSVGLMQKNLKMEPMRIIESFCRAHLYRPSRAEPLFELSGLYIGIKNYLLSYEISKYALSLPAPRPLELFVVPWVYDWGILTHFFHSACVLGRVEEAEQALKMLLDNPNLPERQRQGLEKETKTLEMIKEKLK